MLKRQCYSDILGGRGMTCKRLRLVIILFIFIITSLLMSEISYSQDEKVYSLPDLTIKKVIPFQNYNNLIIIPVIINNQFSTKFILDSGARSTVLIERAIADLLQIPLAKQIIVHGAGLQEEVVAYIAHGVSIVPDGVVGDTTTIYVLERDYLDLPKYLGIEVHGILGYGFFKDFIVEVNYLRNEIILHDPEEYHPPRRYNAVDIDFINNKPYINVELELEDGKKEKGEMLIDLGASHAALIELKNNIGVTIPENHIETSLGRGLSGDILGYIARVKAISFSDYSFNNVVSSYTYGYSKIKQHGRLGTLGGDLFCRFNVIFDYSKEKMYLKPNKQYSKSFEYNMSGLELLAFGLKYKRIKVSGVVEDSPAFIAGLQEGDEIIRCNWVSVRYSNLNWITSQLRAHDGKKMRLVILRDGKKMRFSFKLKKYI